MSDSSASSSRRDEPNKTNPAARKSETDEPMAASIKEPIQPVSEKFDEIPSRVSKSFNTNTKEIPDKDTPILPPHTSNKKHGHISNDEAKLLHADSTVLNHKNADENVHNQAPGKEVKVIPLKETTEICPICLDTCTESKALDKCGHEFCSMCIDQYFQKVKPQCPCCFTIYGEIRGDQPENGTMTVKILKRRLPGFKSNSYGTIEIVYCFPDGIQDERHAHPGMPYYGTTRIAYLPENHDGRHILGLLRRAFELRQIFTVGQSRTTGHDNVVTWNDIHHKTSFYGGMEQFGYPDDTYINRVKQELAAKGIQ